MVDSYPYTWCGQTAYYDNNWQPVVDEWTDIKWNDHDWNRAKVRLNTSKVYINTFGTTCGFYVHGIFAHEMGHALSLAHPEDNTVSVMRPIAPWYNEVQPADVDAIRLKY